MTKPPRDTGHTTHPEAVTLDLFGTLVDFSIERDEEPLVADLLADAETDAAPSDVLATWVTQSLQERGKTPFRTVRTSLVRGAEQTAAAHDLSIDPHRWAHRLEELWGLRPLRGEAREVLDRLDRAGIPWAIVSNVDEPVLEELLDRTGLDERAPTVVSSHRARAYKPHPRPFRMALERLGVAPDRAVHVGDSPAEDQAGARATGMQARLVDPEARSLAAVFDELFAEP